MAVNPEFIYFQMNFFEEIRNILNRHHLRLQFRSIRDTSNPFELPNEKFIKLFRLNKTATLELIQDLEMFVNEPTRKDKVPFHLQVFASLLFYSQGGYQTTVGEDYNLGISQPMISRILNKISNLISVHLLPRYIKFPTTANEVINVKEGFLNKGFLFPNVIGTIDCTHIAIVSPKIDHPVTPAVAYLNRKGFHSINVQAIFDSNLMILNVNARYPGAVHDAAIWEASSIHRYCRRRYQEGIRNNYLLGDSGYPIQPWLMTPILDAPPNTPQAVYNDRHIRTRNVVERGFGVWKARFRCLRKDRVLHYSHATAGRIIYACAVLHNICRKYNIQNELDANMNDDEDGNDNYINANDNVNDDILTEGRFIRGQIVNQMVLN
ncbi:putative nuclease HARBI1 [Anoplophora glabripennis]|uniref:putative nuclease HARBI1 n=1 Tax=Anoplophora glabripennis TaxID=217634 RepID=UPI000874770F|nr:putative nuclease HARBI1 [Anoplophora glabripennis]